MIDIVERINELVEMKCWTFYELSKQSGIAPNTVYEWNRGTIPSLANIEKVCEALDITLEQFFCGIESYKLTSDENRILSEWMVLSKLEKDAILKLIEVFKILKRDK